MDVYNVASTLSPSLQSMYMKFLKSSHAFVVVAGGIVVI